MAASIRVTVPSPRLATQTEPKPTAMSCGSRPTGDPAADDEVLARVDARDVPSPELTTHR